MPALASFLLVLTACVPNLTSPARTTGAYAEKAASTAEASLSAAGTVLLAVRAAIDGDGTGPYLSVTVGDAENHLSDTVDTFAAILPPTDDSDQIRDELLALLDPASSDVAEARIAVRRGDRAPLPDVVEKLERDIDSLTTFAEEYR